MKIFNRSGIKIDEALWRRVTELLRIEEQRSESSGGKNSELTVIVDVPKSHDGGHNSFFGRHKPSKIMIHPCPDCAEGAALIMFLQEIIHEWVSCYRPKLYDQQWSEELCVEVARSVFQLLGGKISGKKNCHIFNIDLPVDPFDDQSEVAQLLSGMEKLTPDQLRHFGSD